MRWFLLQFTGFVFALPLLIGSSFAQDVVYEQHLLDEGTHPTSLLGAHYTDLQYVWMNGGLNSQITGDIEGALTTFNVPARWNRHLPEYIGQDVFISTSWLNGGVSGSVMSLDYEARSFSTGLNTWLYLNDDVRPFVQLGLGTQFGALGVRGPTIIGSNFTLGELDNSLVVNPGVEIVLHEDIFWRSQLNINTDGRFDHSVWRTELVAWLGEHVFLRGGAVGDVSGDGIGGTIGAGIAW